MEPTWRGKVGPRWPSWSQDGPRERQDGAKMAKLEPTWLQDAKDASTWADIVPILKKLRFPLVFVDLREPQVAKREPRTGQDGQVGAKMALRWPKRPPRWPSRSQDGANISKMAQDVPARAGISAQHGPRLRITAPVHRISPSRGGGPDFRWQTVSMGGTKVYINKE